MLDPGEHVRLARWNQDCPWCEGHDLQLSVQQVLTCGSAGFDYGDDQNAFFLWVSLEIDENSAVLGVVFQSVASVYAAGEVAGGD